MRVDRLDLGVFKELADTGVGLTRLGDYRIRHHPFGIKAAEGQDPPFKDWRDLIHIFCRLTQALRYEDRVARPIRVRDFVADVVEQQYGLTQGTVRQADAARKGWAVDRHPDNALFGKLLIRQPEEPPERSWI